jgi:hypothetical protein
MDLMSLFVILAFAGMILSYAVLPVMRHRVDRRTAALDAAASQHQPERMAPAAPRPSPAPAPARAAVPTVAPVRALSFQETFGHLQRAIHLMIVGPTNAGKSTAAMAVLYGRYRAGEKIIILDPHADPDTWGGLSVVGAGRDYEAIDEAMERLLVEMSDRYQRKANRDTDYPAITVFIDEWPSIQLHCKKTAARFMPEMAQEARKVNIRLVILTQSDQVESLGIQGKGDVRENFTMLLLGTKAITAAPTTRDLEWPSAIRRGSQLDAIPVITAAFPAYANAAIDPACIYPLTPPKPIELPADETDEVVNVDAIWEAFQRGEDLLKTPAHTGIKTGEGADFSPPIPAIPVYKSPLSDDIKGKNTDIAEKAEKPGELPNDDRSIAIRAMLDAGLSRNRIVGVLGGDRNAVLKRIKFALGEIESMEAVVKA